MGRSRGVTNTAENDAQQKSKRRRVASGGEPLEKVSSGSGSNEGKGALYHCNYCNKDISGKIRIKCSKCPDFDLCVECFSVGAEVTPHKSNHPYRVMDNLSFPLICSDWNADEEILLLEGIEMYGLGNWSEVAEHVGTKSKTQCIEHYTAAYMNSPCYPLPDMSRVNGKNRKELLAMAKIQASGDAALTEESPFSPLRVKVEDTNDAAIRSPSSMTTANKKASNMGILRNGSDGMKVQVPDIHADRSVGVKKRKVSGDGGPSLAELSCYNPKRQEFDPEYDNEAEKVLAEMEFKDTDTETERELKLRVLRIYLSRLEERKRRKDFILERNLLFPNPLEKDLSSEDREIYNRYKVFMRFLSCEEHEAFMRSIIEERKLRRRIQELQDCRAAGCQTLSEAKMYTEQKRKNAYELGVPRNKEGGQILLNKLGPKGGPHVKVEHDILQSSAELKKSGSVLDLGIKDSSVMNGLGIGKSWEEWDINGLPGTDLLSATEQILCCQYRLLPSHYLKMQEVLVHEMFKGNVRKADAHGLFKVEPTKVDKVYDIVAKKLGHSDESQFL